ncbi:7TM diverse intracellular signaling domain-containing protein [Leptospira noguchii]|uniref:7TM diverse intracellular signaling n=1 Tax=Leptospira noguchii serovar Panama str. CZ214 TaxID=1001595 RepID=T0GWH6_9LEPT|nr:7TM diverse intracellular signaling domain-containing protein [Leptospira noguchii]EQA73307.1 7TM diverse intracellular signaling [Leptospira noguchii serovar Panama str. CZ214]
MKIIKILGIIFPILLTLPAFSETIPWNENQVRLGIYSHILEDPDSSLTIESVQNKEFQQSNQTNPSFGFTRSAYWLKFSFNNPEETFKEKLLEITFPLIDEVIFYSPENETYQQTIVGIKKPFTDRPIESHTFVFPIHAPPGVSTFYLRFKNEDSMQMPLILWEPDAFYKNIRDIQYINGIYFGILIAMAVYNLFLLFTVRNKSYFFYVFYILCFAIFLMSQYGFAYEYLWPEFSWGARRMNPFLAGLLEFSILLFTRDFLDTKNAFPTLHKFNHVLIVLCAMASFSSFFVNLTQGALQVAILGLLTAISIFASGIKALISGFRPARYFMIAFSALLLGGVFYALKTIGAIPVSFITEYSMQIGSGLEVTLLSLGLGDRISRLIKEKQETQKELIQEQNDSIEKQAKLNESFARFVPSKLIHLLGKNEVIQVALGDQIQKEMTVLFSDIRSFTELSESMNPQENFNFLNSYLERMTPAIEKHSGTIDKFIGDAIMALFETNAEDGLMAALEMHRQLKLYNADRNRHGYKPIETGIAVHKGPVMLGTIGSKNRMEVTVISDTVNTASRIEGLTKNYGAKILLSETAFSSLKDPSQFLYRYLGRTFVRGKKEDLSILEFCDTESDEAEQFFKTKSKFERGVFHFFEEEYTSAFNHFRDVLSEYPTDSASAWYLQACRTSLKNK